MAFSEIGGFDKISNSNKGNIKACKNCSGLVCCGLSKPGGIVEPPFLTDRDINQICFGTNMKEGDFSSDKINPLTGNIVRFMQTQDSGGCTFFNKFTGKCGIYSFRPMDCRLFPIDVIFEEEKYYWSLYKYKRCIMTNDDILSLMSLKEYVIESLGRLLHDYATIPTPGMSKIGYHKLSELS